MTTKMSRYHKQIIVRTYNTKANTTFRNTNKLIKKLLIQTVDNSNISEKHLGKFIKCK